MGWQEATLLACAQAAITSVYEGDVACERLCDGETEAAAKHATAARSAAARAAAQARSLKLKLPSHSRRARMAQQAAQTAEEAARGAQAAMDVADLDRALGRAQRAALALFKLVGAEPPDKPIPYQ